MLQGRHLLDGLYNNSKHRNLKLNIEMVSNQIKNKKFWDICDFNSTQEKMLKVWYGNNVVFFKSSQFKITQN